MKSMMVYSFFLIVLSTCNKKPEEMSGATIGSLNIIADENMRYIVEQEEEIFERSYKYAHLDITYTNEFDMFQQFLIGTARMIMAYRTLTPAENAHVQQQKVTPKQYGFATGAIAFIANKNAPDTTYTYEEMISMFQEGKEGIVYVIENVKSGITNDILGRIGTQTLPAHFYAFPSKEEVLDYVKAHDRAIGIVDYSDISDSDLPYTRDVLASTTLLGISRPMDSLQFGFIKPFQYNLQDRKYPFTRDLYLISRTGMTDVGTGFAAFITGEIGQKIILKAGLLPKYQTERALEINRTTDIKVVK